MVECNVVTHSVAVLCASVLPLVLCTTDGWFVAHHSQLVSLSPHTGWRVGGTVEHSGPLPAVKMKAAQLAWRHLWSYTLKSAQTGGIDQVTLKHVPCPVIWKIVGTIITKQSFGCSEDFKRKRTKQLPSRCSQ